MRRGLVLLTIAALLAGPAGVIGTAKVRAADCSGVTLTVSSASAAASATTTLAVTAQGVASPGLAGFQFTIGYNPTLATVVAVQGGPAFPQTQSDLESASQGTVSVAGASAQGTTGSPLLATLTVRAAAGVVVGSVAVFQVEDVSLVDPGPNPIAACPGSAGSLSIISGPQVTAISPPGGAAAGGTAVTISGSGFTGATAVRFGGRGVSDVTVVSDGEITTVSPPGSGSLDVTVTTPLGTSPTSPADRFTYASLSGPTLVLTAATGAAPVGDAVVVRILLLAPDGNPEASQTVSLTASGNAGLSSASATTDAGGQASVYLSDVTAQTVVLTAGAAGGAAASLSVAFTRLAPVTASASPPAGGVSLAPPSTLPLSGSLVGSDQVQFTLPGGPSGAGAALGLTLTVPAAQAAAVLGSVSASVDDAADEATLLQQSGDISLAVGAPSVAGPATFAGPVIGFQTSGAANQRFGDETVQTTNPDIELTLPYDPSTLSPGESPTVLWLDTSQTPAVWTDQGVVVVALGSDSVTALLPHLSLYTVAGVTLRTATALALVAGQPNPTVGETASLTATVDDQAGQPLPGVDVAFQSSAGQLSASGATTDAQGQATVQLTSAAAGSITVTAAVAGIVQAASTAVDFAAPSGSSGGGGTGGGTGTGGATSGGQGSPAQAPGIPSGQAAAHLPFSDVPPGYWAAADIAALVTAGVANGFPDGTFRPDAPVTRAQFVKWMDLVLDLPPARSPDPFRDVPGDAWYAPYVASAATAGIVTGLTPTTFGPDQPLTREQLAVLLARALKLTRSTALPYSDDARIDSWAEPGVAEAVAAGYVNGFPDGSFRPQGTATRAQAAKILALVLAARPEMAGAASTPAAATALG